MVLVICQLGVNKMYQAAGSSLVQRGNLSSLKRMGQFSDEEWRCKTRDT